MQFIAKYFFTLLIASLIPMINFSVSCTSEPGMLNNPTTGREASALLSFGSDSIVVFYGPQPGVANHASWSLITQIQGQREGCQVGFREAHGMDHGDVL